MAGTNAAPVVDEGLEDDAAEFGSLKISLEDDEDRAEQLSGRRYINLPSDEDELRLDVTGREGRAALWGGKYIIQVSCEPEKLRFGTWDDQPALLMVFDFAFETLNTSAVFRSADITVTLQKHARILAFEPHNFSGTLDRRDRETKLSTKAGLSGGPPSTATANGEVSYERPNPSIKEGAHLLHSIAMSNKSKLVVSIKENKLVENTGMLREFSVPVIVRYEAAEPEPGFEVNMVVQADLGWQRFFRAVCGENDEPLKVNTARLRRSAERRNEAGMDLKTAINMRSLTRLDERNIFEA